MTNELSIEELLAEAEAEERDARAELLSTGVAASTLDVLDGALFDIAAKAPTAEELQAFASLCVSFETVDERRTEVRITPSSREQAERDPKPKENVDSAPSVLLAPRSDLALWSHRGALVRPRFKVGSWFACLACEATRPWQAEPFAHPRNPERSTSRWLLWELHNALASSFIMLIYLRAPEGRWRFVFREQMPEDRSCLVFGEQPNMNHRLVLAMFDIPDAPTGPAEHHWFAPSEPSILDEKVRATNSVFRADHSLRVETLSNVSSGLLVR